MTRFNRILLVFCLIGGMAILGACTGTSEEAPPPTDTQPPPTEEPLPPIEDLGPLTVTYDGNECTLSGPTQVSLGNFTVINDNQTETSYEIYIKYLSAGKTNQDFVALQDEPGTMFDVPDWAEMVRYSFAGKDEMIFLFESPGEHAVFLGGTDSYFMWICPPILLVE